MAESLSSFKQKFDDQLTCSVCLDQYVNPKTLPCHHSFCLECVQRLPANEKLEKYQIRCPTCRVEHQLPKKGAADLPNAFQINTFLELRKDLGIKKSAMMKCTIHNDPLRVYCETCCEVICRDCSVSKKHRIHDYELISECYPQHHQQIEAQLTQVKQKRADINTAMDGLHAREKEVINQGEKTKEEVHKHAQQLIEQVQRSERRLIQEVDTIVEQKKEILLKQREAAERAEHQLKTCEEMIEQKLKEMSQVKILMEKQTMVDQMKQSSEHAEPTVFLPIEEANTQFIKQAATIDDGIGRIKSNRFGKAIIEAPQSLSPNKKSTATITLHSHNASPFVVPDSLITCTLSSPDLPHPMKCGITHTKDDGTYIVSFEPQSNRRHQLTVQVGGIDVQGSRLEIWMMPLKPCKTINLQYEHYYIAKCGNGDILATEQDTHCITILNKEGQMITSLKGSNNGQFKFPFGLAISTDGHILVTDRHRLQKLRFDGVCLKSVGSSERGSGQLQFADPAGIAVHPTTGQIFVADEGNNRVQVFNADLTFSHKITLPGQLQLEPRDVALNDEGYLYVAEMWNYCITKFTTAGQFITRFGRKGSAPGQLSQPVSLVVHSNTVYVSERGNHRVSVFDTQGKFVHCFGKKGTGQGEFNILWGVAVDDRAGSFYVSDLGNKRILEYDYYNFL